MDELLKQLGPIMIGSIPGLIGYLLLRWQTNTKIELLKAGASATRETQDGEVTLRALSILGESQTRLLDGVNRLTEKITEQITKADVSQELDRKRLILQEAESESVQIAQKASIKAQQDHVVQLAQNTMALDKLATSFGEALGKAALDNRDHVTNQVALGLSDVKQFFAQGLQPVNDKLDRAIKLLDEIAEALVRIAAGEQNHAKELKTISQQVTDLADDMRKEQPIPDSVKNPLDTLIKTEPGITDLGHTPPKGTEIPKEVK